MNVTEKNVTEKRAQEQEMLRCMIQIYCRGNHSHKRHGSDNYDFDNYGSDSYGSDNYGSDNYGSDKHAHKHGLCEDCRKLLAYAAYRSQKCPFMETKSFCSSCEVHCYAPEMRQRIQEVMRYAGPRMMLYHPLPAILHMYTTLQKKLSKKRQQNL